MAIGGAICLVPRLTPRSAPNAQTAKTTSRPATSDVEPKVRPGTVVSLQEVETPS